MYYKKLQGENVYLSPLDAEDYRIFTKWMNNLKTTIRTGSSEIIISEAAEYKYLQGKENSSYQFGIVTEAEDELIGTVEIMEISHLHQSAVVGIFIGAEENRGKGYGKEAMNLILDYAFNILNLNSMSLNVFDFNVVAKKMYEAVGFKVVGKKREAYIVADHKFDIIIMDILKSEFEYENIKKIVDKL